MNSTDTLDLRSEATAGPVECLGQTFPSDQVRREHYLKLLAEKLKDPEFRKIEGFPTGSDEAILRLSDPPYFTACPNPFIEDFVRSYGKAYDPSTPYSKEPFATDVTEGKNDPIYNAHGYHTKVPHKAIMRYILHYTQPGDVVFDGFCGTGMTGVAAQLCGDRAAVQSLGYRIDSEGNIFQEDQDNGQATWTKFSKLGARRALLGDLSPAATFISHNYNVPKDRIEFDIRAKDAIFELEKRFGWMYQTLHLPTQAELEATCQELIAGGTLESVSGVKIGRINYVVWSDVFSCPECAGEIVFWNSAVDVENGKVRESFPCPHCQSTQTKRSLDHALVSFHDSAVGDIVKQAKIAPVRINYSVGSKRFDKSPDVADLTLCARVDKEDIEAQYPSNRLFKGGETRRNDPIGITHVHHFYTKRNLSVFAYAFEKMPFDLKWAVSGSLQRGSKQHQIAITRVGGEKAGVGGATAGHRRGTLYVPSNQVEVNAIGLISDRLAAFRKAILSNDLGRPAISTQSTTQLLMPDDSVDYFFFDPPFGKNISYSELNSIMESWLGVMTNREPEAIEDRHQKKSVNEYRDLMIRCFKEAYRVLKPGRWMTVEFSNTQAVIWNAIQTGLQEAGFVVANVSALDKKRGGLNAIVGVTAVKQDLVISAYKPNGGLEQRFAQRGATPESAWDFVQTHLKQLPVVKMRNGELEFVAERDPRILFDRMVAWFVRHSAPVPFSSQEFRDGLRSRFPDRDGMVFLSDQVAEYDKKRAQVAQAPQMDLFVSDERSAIDWLTDFLKRRPSTYQEVHPELTAQLGAGWKKHEAKPELMALLENNFLKYDGTGEVPSQIHSYLSTNHKDLRGLEKSDPRLIAKAKDRWFVPDPNKAQDLEKKREKALLKEFQEYEAFTGRRLKEFRLEALRAGFNDAWGKKDYQTILAVAQKIPEQALQEDEKLLRWYDYALTRTEDGL
ncbi:DNA methylase [Billgrantia diversa]|uniref:DNA methyltransferase n=1 Tax=Halomonas sp. MCCC 1A13316 TaxID=2733487 RepID=UPI0018A35E26|nr:DNA methyltransferase [Halomonas sp. MCCC 1A13316]QOR40631.1 DNA methylase [Halomonas sp. MCCC 1A13316]